MVTNSTALQPVAAMPPVVSGLLRDLRPNLQRLLPTDILPEQFRAALYLELQGRPALYNCLSESLRDCAIKAATYGMLPGRDCHFLPFRNRHKGGKQEATFVPNYHGIILALERSGKVRRAFAHPVHEGDVWEFDTFADRPIHKPAVTLGKQPGKELFYYGAVMFRDGTCSFEVLTLDDLDSIRRRSPTHEQGPWVTDRVMMCRKSAIKRVAKYVRLTPELQTMLQGDALREQTDIPEERTRQNIADLFDDRINPTAYTGPVQSGSAEEDVDVESPDAAQEQEPDAPASGETGTLGEWGEAANRALHNLRDAELAGKRLPRDLLRNIEAALRKPHETTAAQRQILVNQWCEALA